MVPPPLRLTILKVSQPNWLLLPALSEEPPPFSA
jgi:hypothetical protein